LLASKFRHLTGENHLLHFRLSMSSCITWC